MRARRAAVARTREQILEAAYALWIDQPYDEVTLEAVAGVAGVSRQTVHRQFGSKDELFLAVIDWRRPHEMEVRHRSEPGDVAGAVASYVDRYERMGDTLVRFLGLEGRIEAVDGLLEQGRTDHIAELEHAFEPHLPRAGTNDRTRAVMALYAATDVMVWKLLRRDFDRSRDETEMIIRQLVEGVLHTLATPEEATP
jgi:AcrR family transcriptional regulator